MLIQIKDGKPYGNPVLESNFRQLFQNEALPVVLTPQVVEARGFAFYEFSEAPAIAPNEKHVELEPVLGKDGVWRQTWSVSLLSGDELATKEQELSQRMRAVRDGLLSKSDWVVIVASEQRFLGNASAGIDQAWAAYRQELRDVTAQPDFPWEVSWPVSPAEAS